MPREALAKREEVNVSKIPNINFFCQHGQINALLRDVLGLKLEKHLELPNDYGYMFEVNNDWKLWLGRHSEVKGKHKDKFRHIFNLYVDSVSEWYNKIRNIAEVTIICKPCETPLSTPDDRVYVCTFLDPEDNCWQFMGRR